MERVVDEEIFRDGLSLEIPSKIFLKYNVASLKTWFGYHKNEVNSIDYFFLCTQKICAQMRREYVRNILQNKN